MKHIPVKESVAGFRTDYEILTDISMKRAIRDTKKK